MAELYYQKNKEPNIIHFALPKDQNMNCTEQEKVLKYLCLRIEKLWNLRAVIVLIVVGELGTVSVILGKNLKRIELSSPPIFAGSSFVRYCLHSVKYWVPQSSGSTHMPSKKFQSKK